LPVFVGLSAIVKFVDFTFVVEFLQDYCDGGTLDDYLRDAVAVST